MRSSGPERVRVRVRLGSDGALAGAEASGHAGARPAGSNVACAAVTVLLRTAYETAAAYDGVKASGRAPEPGSLSFEISRYPAQAAERLRGVADFLCTGLSAVQREYPGSVELIIDR